MAQFDKTQDPEEWINALRCHCTLAGLDADATLEYAKLMVGVELRDTAIIGAADISALTEALRNIINGDANLRAAARRKLQGTRIDLARELRQQKQEVKRMFATGQIHAEADKVEYLMRMLGNDLYALVWARNPQTEATFFDCLQVIKDQQYGPTFQTNYQYFPSQPQPIDPSTFAQYTSLPSQASNFGLPNMNNIAPPPRPTDMDDLVRSMKEVTAHLAQVADKFNRPPSYNSRPQRNFNQRPRELNHVHPSQFACYNCRAPDYGIAQYPNREMN
jgi:hypothetical protein